MEKFKISVKVKGRWESFATIKAESLGDARNSMEQMKDLVPELARPRIIQEWKVEPLMKRVLIKKYSTLSQ